MSIFHMEMNTCEIMTDSQYWNYLKEKYYNHDTVVVVDKTFLKNVMWRYGQLQRLQEIEAEYKSVIEGAKIKEEMGL